MPLVVLSELRGNQSDFCPALGQINRQGLWNKAPRIFMYAERGMSGMWTWQVTSLCLQIRPADSCLLLLLPRSPQFVFVYRRNVCEAVNNDRCLKFPQNNVYSNKKLCS